MTSRVCVYVSLHPYTYTREVHSYNSKSQRERERERERGGGRGREKYIITKQSETIAKCKNKQSLCCSLCVSLWVLRVILSSVVVALKKDVRA